MYSTELLTDDCLNSPKAPARAAIRYDKYTVAGNTFLVIDETKTPLPSDAARSNFARWALDGYFGVGGADNILYIGRGPRDRIFTFRIFEYDGAETLSCGNGLLAAGHLVSRHHDGNAWTFLTELPTTRPRPVQVTAADGSGRMRVDTGPPRPVPADLYRRRGAPPTDALEELALTVDLSTQASPHTAWPGPAEWAGHLVFTGEPHLVFVLGHGAPPLDSLFFPARRTPENLALMERLGRFINTTYQELFPRGIHVNIVGAHQDGLRYRTWERAIDQETLACGTGALAAAHVCWSRQLAHQRTIALRPHRANWHCPGTTLHVSTGDRGALQLEGHPTLVCSGSVPADRIPDPTQEESW